MPLAQVNRIRLNYLQTGLPAEAGAENLVMVHGLATNMAFWYLHYVPAFSRRFRVTLLDLRGHGRSDMPPQGYTPHHLGVDLQGLLDHLGIARAHFVAHSFGGVAALSMACLDPGRVASLVLADTHIAAARRAPEASDWGHGEVIQAVLDRHGLSLDTRDPYFGYRLLSEVAQLQMKNTEVPPELLDLVRPLFGQQGNRTATQWLKLMATTRAETELMGDDGLTLEKLRTLGFPILAMYGDRSRAQMTGRQLLEVWPHAEFRRVRNAGHFFPTSKPAEVIDTCNRFWHGELSRKRRYRLGESGKSHFRSDRMFEQNGAWFCSTRECDAVGPFANLREAETYLTSYIAQRATG